MTESSLAELVPLWRTIREDGVTALVTPALDYVGGFEVGAVDARFVTDEVLGGTGEALRRFVGGLEDECTLHFIYRVAEESEEDIREYETACGRAEPAALRAYVVARARWLRAQRLRRTRIYVFFSGSPAAKSALSRGQLGLRLVFGDLGKLSEDEHKKKLKALVVLRDRLAARLAQMGLSTRELAIEDVWRLHYELLNPSRARSRLAAPLLSVRDNLWAPSTVREQGEHLLEYSEAEQLVFEDFEESRGHFMQGDIFRRACTLKILPEADRLVPHHGAGHQRQDAVHRAFDGRRRHVRNRRGRLRLPSTSNSWWKKTTCAGIRWASFWRWPCRWKTWAKKPATKKPRSWPRRWTTQRVNCWTTTRAPLPARASWTTGAAFLPRHVLGASVGRTDRRQRAASEIRAAGQGFGR